MTQLASGNALQQRVRDLLSAETFFCFCDLKNIHLTLHYTR